MYSKYIKNIKNEYSIIRPLGPTGNTVLVEHIESHKKRVAKIYDEWEADEEQQSFLNEIGFRVSEKYPELIAIKALNFKDFNDENRPTIIIDYMEDGSLEDKFLVLETNQKIIILYSIANCLSFLHSNKISHLNLHPRNILLDPSNFPRITDYYGYKTIS